LTAAPRPAASFLRKLVTALILVPLAILIIAFAVANRQKVTVSFDPFSAEHPAAAVTLPLFALVIVLLILGVVIGGVATWLGHGRGRRLVRRMEREAAELRREIDAHRRAAAGPAHVPQAIEPPQRLKLKPPTA
jgi:uncharacterized membrane protein YciS (DUF1049 family)